MKKLLALLTFFFILPALPFFFSAVLPWDMEGHFFSALLQSKMWPNIYFWNPYFFLGYNQFSSYPPLFTLLVAFFSKMMPILFAFKGLIFLSWLAVPASVYFFCQSFLEKNEGLLSTALMCICLLVAIPAVHFWKFENFGGTFASTFLIGNITNLFALPLFFLTAGLVQKQRLRFVPLVVAIMLISHTVVATAAILFVGISILTTAKDRLLKGFSIVLAFAIAAFWIVPFFSLQDQFLVLGNIAVWSIGEILTIAIVVLYFLFEKQSANSQIKTVFYFVVFLLVMVLFSILMLKVANRFPFRWERFKFYMYLLATPLLILFLNEISAFFPRLTVFLRARTGLISISILFIAVSLFTTNYSLKYFQQPIPSVATPALPQQGSRVLTLSTYNRQISENPLGMHHQTHFLANQGLLVAKGLFSEATSNSRAVFDLEQAFSDQYYVFNWGVNWDKDMTNLQRESTPPEKLAELTRIFSSLLGIGTVLPLFEDEGFNTNIMNSSNSQERRLVSLPPIERGTRLSLDFAGPKNRHDWYRLCYLNWLYQDPINTLPVNSVKRDYTYDVNPELRSHDENWNQLEVDLPSQSALTKPVPVLIKMGFSPNWHAIDINGASLPINAACPNILVVWAKKSFKLFYQGFDLPAKIGLFISVVGILTWLALGNLLNLVSKKPKNMLPKS